MVMEAQDTKAMPGYKLTELGVIPEDWDVRKLSEVCNYQNGTSLEKYFNGFQGLNVISIGNYSIDGRYVDTNSYIDWKYHREIKRFILRHNELCMILNDKTSIGAIIGRVLLIKGDNKYVFNQRSMRIVPHETIFPYYLYYAINSDLLHNKIISLAKPGTQIYVNTGDITGLDIPIPKSFKEQRAIATALSDVDTLISSLDKLIAKKRDIKQATMQLLLTGKTRLQGFGKGLKTDYNQTEVGMIPKDWEVKKLGEVCDYQNGTSLEKYFNVHQGLDVISIGNYSTDGKYIHTNSYIDWKYHREIKRFILHSNELCMILNDKTSIGAIIGRVLLIEEDNKYVFNQRSMRLIPHNNLSTVYLYYVINSDFLHARIVSQAKPGTQIYVNTGDVTRLDIPMPKSSEEQQAIATVFSDMDAEIAALEQKRDKTRALKQGMMQELLTGKTRLL